MRVAMPGLFSLLPRFLFLYLSVLVPVSFSQTNQPEGCGVVSYHVGCIANSLTIKIYEKDSLVKNISYEGRVLTVANMAILKDTCYTDNIQFVNVTPEVDNYPLSKCPSPGTVEVACNITSGTEWYYGPGKGDGEHGCSPLVVVPLNETAAEKLEEDAWDWEVFEEAYQEGFNVTSKEGGDWCPKCMESGGVCELSPANASEQTCSCSDETRTAGSCPTKGMSKSTKAIIIGIIASILALILLCSLTCIMQRKKKRNDHKCYNNSGLDDSGPLLNTDFHLMHIATIQVATNTFSMANKLEEAGFGCSKVDLPLLCTPTSSTSFPTMGATTLLFPLFFPLLLFFPHSALSCPIEWLSCDKPENGDGEVRSCGHDSIKCVSYTLHIQFYHKGKWYPAKDLKYPERTVTVRDDSLADHLQTKDCDFLYDFDSPVHSFDPSAITSLNSTASMFDCKADSYNFSTDVFERNYRSSHCGDYDLYYSYKPGDAQPGDNCSVDANTAAAVEWKLSFQDDDSGGMEFILQSVGFSRNRKLSSECFSCRMSSGSCSSVVPAENNNCSCDRKCRARGMSKKTKGIIIGGFSAMVFVCLVAAFVFCCFWSGEQNDHKCHNNSGLDDSGPLINVDFHLMHIATIRVATNTFSVANKLGEGGFGSVYKGILQDGKDVAVKRLSSTSTQGSLEFKNEVRLIAKLQHRNLVRLLGCCVEGEEKLLVYEYLPNGSLDTFLFDVNKRSFLDWRTRQHIIFGISRGLLYLHEDSQLKVIHRDLKASNILLDLGMNPKISDFGLARIFSNDENEANTNRVVGTYGYMAPEFAMEGLFSAKSDVYSYGVLLLEIVTGEKNGRSHLMQYEQSLPKRAWQMWKEGKGLEMIDPFMVASCSTTEALRCIHVGLLCVQENATDRPTMLMVLHMLRNEHMVLREPKQPPSFMRTNVSIANHSSLGTTKLASINEVTLSDLQTR